MIIWTPLDSVGPCWTLLDPDGPLLVPAGPCRTLRRRWPPRAHRTHSHRTVCELHLRLSDECHHTHTHPITKAQCIRRGGANTQRLSKHSRQRLIQFQAQLSAVFGWQSLSEITKCDRCLFAGREHHRVPIWYCAAVLHGVLTVGSGVSQRDREHTHTQFFLTSSADDGLHHQQQNTLNTLKTIRSTVQRNSDPNSFSQRPVLRLEPGTFSYIHTILVCSLSFKLF